MSDQVWYKRSPIATVEALAKCLGVQGHQLLNIADRSAELYRPGKAFTKGDGSVRQTHNAADPLKHVHRRIKNRLLLQVEYPPYLKGSLANSPTVVRGTKGHIHPHLACSVALSEDIENFFPSISACEVEQIWKTIFAFTPEVAALLTELTTHNGYVPQGWIPSSHIANMALWRKERGIVAWCAANGFEYTRYVDDIVISSKYPISNELLTECVRSVHQMLCGSGYKMKRSKHSLSRDGSAKTICGQNIDRGRPTLPKQVRAKIRAAVNHCERMVDNDEPSEAINERIRSVQGRLAYMSSFHPAEASKLSARLQRI